jgi:hypothetical protein
MSYAYRIVILAHAYGFIVDAESRNKFGQIIQKDYITCAGSGAYCYCWDWSRCTCHYNELKISVKFKNRSLPIVVDVVLVDIFLGSDVNQRGSTTIKVIQPIITPNSQPRKHGGVDDQRCNIFCRRLHLQREKTKLVFQIYF